MIQQDEVSCPLMSLTDRVANEQNKAAAEIIKIKLSSSGSSLPSYIKDFDFEKKVQERKLAIKQRMASDAETHDLKLKRHFKGIGSPNFSKLSTLRIIPNLSKFKTAGGNSRRRNRSMFPRRRSWLSRHSRPSSQLLSRHQ